MRSIALFLLFSMAIIVGSASAYELIITTPGAIPAGAPLSVTGTTSFPAGTTFDMVFSSSGQVGTQVASVPVTVSGDKNENGDRTFNVIFDTTGLPGGQYKVEAVMRGNDAGSLSSSSQTLRIVQLVDRSGEIHITSPLNQRIPNALLIEGYLDNAGNSGVQINVLGPQGGVFGPAFIATQTQGGGKAGYFSKNVAVDQEGNYKVTFTDSLGSYIGEKTFSVSGPLPTITSPVTLPETTIPTTTIRTSTPVVTTAAPTPTKSPAPIFGILAGLCAAGFLVSGKFRK
ncbi:MAG TPA: hypothetical protein VMS89_08020 [Methanoregulaceae archaeon]|nr:hypothetical protein [Methanoregulaceae archaeon]